MKQKSTIVIIEDDRADAGSLAKLCRQLGYRPLVAYDCATGLKLAASNRPRLILSDVGVPGLDGFEMARRVRTDHALDGIPVVAMTGQAPATPAANQVAFDDYVLKPLAAEPIKNVITKYCPLS